MERNSVIFVHGIGPQQVGYSRPLCKALWGDEPPEDVYTYEVKYDQVFEVANEKGDVSKMVEKYGLSKVFERIAERIGRDREFVDDMLQTSSDILKNTVSHVLFFLTNQDVSNRILGIFEEKLLDVLDDAQGVPAQDHGITVISHSLGTIVAYMGAHRAMNIQGLSLRDGVRIQNLFTLASPLGLIQEVANRLGVLVDLPKYINKISTPGKRGRIRRRFVRYVNTWYSYRHKFDPVASFVPLVDESLDNRDESPYVFGKAEIANVHSFENYVKQARDLILAGIGGTQ